MADPDIARDSNGEAALLAQQLLNRTGAILDEDGDFGPDSARATREFQAQHGLTVSGVVDQATWDALRAVADPFPDISTTALAFIARQEVGSRPDYDQVYCRPEYPGYGSGITIGVGYDLKEDSRVFERDWTEVLTPLLTAAQLGRLRDCLGKQGTHDMAESLADIVIPWQVAWHVFLAASVPDNYAETRTAFPGVERLSPLCRGVLLSVVFNRGGSMDDGGASTQPRREMREIRDAIAAGQYQPISGLIGAMARLWPAGSDLYKRRLAEASLFAHGL